MKVASFKQVAPKGYTESLEPGMEPGSMWNPAIRYESFRPEGV